MRSPEQISEAMMIEMVSRCAGKHMPREQEIAVAFDIIAHAIARECARAKLEAVEPNPAPDSDGDADAPSPIQNSPMRNTIDTPRLNDPCGKCGVNLTRGRVTDAGEHVLCCASCGARR